MDYRRRTTVVGFKWRKSVVDGELQVENYSGWLQMKSSVGLPRSTRVVSVRWRATAENDGGELEIIGHSLVPRRSTHRGRGTSC